MALGGGTFIAQNKVLPGSYINFVAAARASVALSERGIVAMPLKMSWGPEEEVFEVTRDDFVKNCKKIFGYDYADDEMLGMRELFKNAKKGLFFRLGSGADYAENTYAKAVYPGERGNDISFAISKNNDKVTFDIKTLLDNMVVDIQKAVTTTTDLKPNGFVNWKGLELTPGTTDLKGGANATEADDNNPAKEALASENQYAKAKTPGVGGNAISIVVKANGAKYDVETVVDGVVVDVQKSVASTTDLKPNKFVSWKGEPLLPIAKDPLKGGVNCYGDGSEDAYAYDYDLFLDKIESHPFHTLAIATADQALNSKFEEFTISMREDKGVKIQTVLYQSKANHEGIISIDNKLNRKDEDNEVKDEMLVYWVAGAEAGCDINKTLTNRTYDGELKVDVDYTQSGLENAIKSGRFVFHRVGGSVRVLEDINTLTEYDDEKNHDFSDNQVIRVLDQIGNDIAALFNDRYLGTLNDESNRIGLWSDIVSHHKQLESLRAIENFESGHVTVEKGEGKNAVVVTDIVTPVCAMTKLYMTVVVE